MFRRVLKYSTVSAVGGTCIYYLNNNYWDVKNIGILRFGRAVGSVALIAADYKWALVNYKDSSQESLTQWGKVHQRAADRLLKLCCTNGGVFIKVGQHIAAMEYLFPQAYTDTLQVLHSRAPISSLKQVKQVVREDLGRNPEELFASFGEMPLGAASLAQVHPATLKDGRKVAVKVQHPNVKRHSFVDIATMDFLVKVIDVMFPEFSFMWVAEEVRRNLPVELDFANEGQNAERVARSIGSKFPWLKIPEVYWNYSTNRVLTMEYVDGGEVTNRQYMLDNGISCREVSHRLGLLYSEMIFLQGHVHSDPHPGNIFVRKSSEGAEIVLMDHGLYAQLTESFRHKYSKMWLSVINLDIEGMKSSATELGVGDLYPFLACIMTHKPWQAIVRGLDRPKNKQSLEQESREMRKYFVQYFPQIANVLSRVDRQIILIFKTNDLLLNIDRCLGTAGERQSLITMSRCCIRAMHAQQLKECKNWWCKFRADMNLTWLETKLTIYQLFLYATVLIWGPEYW